MQEGAQEEHEDARAAGRLQGQDHREEKQRKSSDGDCYIYFSFPPSRLPSTIRLRIGPPS